MAGAIMSAQGAWDHAWDSPPPPFGAFLAFGNRRTATGHEFLLAARCMARWSDIGGDGIGTSSDRSQLISSAMVVLIAHRTPAAARACAFAAPARRAHNDDGGAHTPVMAVVSTCAKDVAKAPAQLTTTAAAAVVVVMRAERVTSEANSASSRRSRNSALDRPRPSRHA